MRTIETDLGPTTLEQHHLVGEGDLVVQHVTLHGTHWACRDDMGLLEQLQSS